MKSLFSLILLIGIFTQPIAAQNNALSGKWEGQITVQGQQLKINTSFNQESGSYSGTIDIPQQMAMGLPLKNIEITQTDSVFFEFEAGPGSIASFKGMIKDDSRSEGTFHQRGMQLPFELERVQQNKPQPENEPERAPAYNSEEMVIKNDSIAIGGTLTWPQNMQANQLVIMISGSGAQDRDESLPGVTSFRPFAELADSLTARGIATFRYDDRGVGQSTGNFADATLGMLASDVEAIINEFTNSSGQQFDEIVLLGHSQGGVVAGKVAAQSPAVDKLILMASTGVPLKELLRFQIEQAFAPANVDSALVEKEITARENLMQAIANGENLEQAQETYRQRFIDIQIAAGMNPDQAEAVANRQVMQLTATFETPQMQSLLFYDPTQDLQQLDIPVLVLFGGKDSQVPAEMNRPPIEQALNQADAPHRIEVLEDANHLFQRAETGQVQEYANLESQFINSFIPLLDEWISK